MAIYIPGWYEQMARSGSISKLGDVLGRKFMPDYRAGQDLQQMMQQNPDLVNSIANMDETQRQAFAKSLGYSSYEKSGLGNIKPSQQLMERQELEKYLPTLTDEQRAIRMAARAGTKTQEEINQNKEIFGLNKKNTELNIRNNEQKIQLQDYELKEKSEYNTLQETLKAKFPADKIDLNAALGDMVRGNTNTPLMQRIMSDPTISPAFNNLFELYKQRVGLQAQMNIAALRSPQEKLLGLQLMQQGVDNAQQEINAAQAAIKNEGIYGQMQMTPTYVQALEALKAAKERHAQFTTAFNRALATDFKMKYPESFNEKSGGISVTGPVNPKIKAAAERILNGTATIQQMEASPSLTPEEKSSIRMLVAAQKGGK